MPAQIGYFDTLKSVAGKVFTYLASITLTGTDGKTITVTQDTSLDEAVAMSSKAPKTDTIKGDGTAGRVERMAHILIQDGTGADTIKCEVISDWNGDVIGSTDNIAKNATTGNFWLSAAGDELKVLDAGITGTVVGMLLTNMWDISNHAVLTQARAGISGSDIFFVFAGDAGAAVDITAFTTGYVILYYCCITSA